MRSPPTPQPKAFFLRLQNCACQFLVCIYYVHLPSFIDFIEFSKSLISSLAIILKLTHGLFFCWLDLIFWDLMETALLAHKTSNLIFSQRSDIPRPFRRNTQQASGCAGGGKPLNCCIKHCVFFHKTHLTLSLHCLFNIFDWAFLRKGENLPFTHTDEMITIFLKYLILIKVKINFKITVL